MKKENVRYELVVKESNEFLVDILCVGTRAGNIPEWAVKSVQQHVHYNRTVVIRQDGQYEKNVSAKWHAYFTGPDCAVRIKVGIIAEEEMVKILASLNFDSTNVAEILRSGHYDGLMNLEFESDAPRVYLLRNIDLFSNDPQAYWNTTAASWWDYENASKFTTRAAAIETIKAHDLSAEIEVEVMPK